MFSNVSSTPFPSAVAATLAMIVSPPSYAGESTAAALPAPMGMGFGPMSVSLMSAARATKPCVAKKCRRSRSWPDDAPGKDDLPPASLPKSLEPAAVRTEAAVIVASEGEVR